MSSNISNYISSYNELDELLNKIVGIKDLNSNIDYIGYKNKLYDIRNGKYSISSFVRRFFDELLKFGYIRNELVHKYQNYIDITDSTIENIEKYINIFKNPKNCYDFFNIDVYKCNENDLLVDIIKVMKNNLFTHIPVYSNKDNFLGILSESTITYFIGSKIENDGTLILENTKIGELKEYFNNGNDLYKFINRKTTIYEIEDLFHNTIRDNKRLGAIFITNLGKESEKIDGIITAWDIPRIKDLYL